MGEGQGRAGGASGWLFEPTFNRAIKLRQADPRITSDAGALLLREVDQRLGLTADLATQLSDPRDPVSTRYTQVELLRQHLYALALLERVQRWWRDEAWGQRGPRRRRWVAPPAHAHLCLVLRE